MLTDSIGTHKLYRSLSGRQFEYSALRNLCSGCLWCQICQGYFGVILVTRSWKIFFLSCHSYNTASRARKRKLISSKGQTWDILTVDTWRSFAVNQLPFSLKVHRQLGTFCLQRWSGTSKKHAGGTLMYFRSCHPKVAFWPSSVKLKFAASTTWLLCINGGWCYLASG